ncbi:hypothetical protein HC256_005389 [Beauveria bassiana]|nr:hypothetical protein HC256_005389 [Beauveria bassiana]
MKTFSVLLLAMLSSFGAAVPVVTPGGSDKNDASRKNANVGNSYLSTLMEDENQNWGYDDSQEPEDNKPNPRPVNYDTFSPPNGSPL